MRHAEIAIGKASTYFAEDGTAVQTYMHLYPHRSSPTIRAKLLSK
jgi:hypothetical protein